MLPSEGTSAVEENRLLRSLPAEQYSQLAAYLEPVQLVSGQMLWEPGAVIHSVYFPRTCVLSILMPLTDEPPVEAATVGREGLLGTPVVLGVRVTNASALAQVPGDGVVRDIYDELLGRQDPAR